MSLHDEPLILALPDLSRFCGSDPIRLAHLKGESFVLYPRHPRPSFADYILDVCRDEGFIPKSLVLAQDYQTAISLVSVGVGVSLVPSSVSQSDRRGVVFRTYIGNNPGTALSLNMRRDNQTVHMLEFMKVAERTAKHSRNIQITSTGEGDNDRTAKASDEHATGTFPTDSRDPMVRPFTDARGDHGNDLDGV